MSSTDSAGRSRPGMFEKIEDPISGATFTPTSGRGNKTQFKVTGPGAAPAPDNTVVSGSPDVDTLRWRAQSQGALSTPDMGLDAFCSPRRGKL